MKTGKGLTGLQNFEVVRIGRECAIVSVDDGTQDSCLGGRRRHLLGQLIEACVVAVPPHVPVCMRQGDHTVYADSILMCTHLHMGARS